MFLSLFRIVARKLLVRKGRLIVAACLFLLGVVGTFYFRADSKALIFSGPARTLRVPSLGTEVVSNKSKSHSQSLPHLNVVNYDTAGPTGEWPQDGGVAVEEEGPAAVIGGPRVLASDTAECITSSLQPATGQVNIQMSSLMDKLPFDNINGGVWKQGYDLTYSMNDFGQAPLKVFVVPHSHNDPGWIKTFEDYYRRQTKNILTLMTNALAEDSRKKFIWAEISYLDLWWREQSDMMKERFKRLVYNGQLEIVTGGWVMNDEANTHYFSMVDQLVEGHTWLQQHLPGVVPKSGWAIDPFGLSPTMTYLLRRSGLDFMVVQRGHYHLKKHLSRRKELEFRWVQEWDRGHDSSVMCHLMPFYIYDIPHTCGPDPKICCQFDFHRLPGNRVSCPWRVRPTAINDQNVRERAQLLADQYRKKSTLFMTNVLLVPLGDDFRWDTNKEINAQFSNYFKLMDYMNSHPEMKIEVRFGTLHDYYKAVRESIGLSAGITNSSKEEVLDSFPTLTGDFFTYADRDDHYWSGYYTSRPFHKHMDRVLGSHLRMAEILFSMLMANGLNVGSSLPQILTEARRNLGLFQHHDGITGTAKDAVVNDYAYKMIAAIRGSLVVSQDALKALLLLEYSEQLHDDRSLTLNPEQTYPNVKALPDMAVLDVSSEKSSMVTFMNSLTYRRVMLVSVLVNSPNVIVTGSQGQPVLCQVNPVLHGEHPASDKFLVVFEVTLPPLGVAHYRVTGTSSQSSKHTVRASIQYINSNPPVSGQVFEVAGSPSARDFVLSTPHNVSAKFSGQTGLLKSLAVGPNEVEVQLDFVTYGTRRGRDKSGAYLFMPGGEAVSMVAGGKPHVVVTVGPLVQEVTSFLSQVKHSVILSNSHGLDARSLTIHNTVDIKSYNTNKEVAMRILSSVDNKNVFYTDLNGFQLTRRKTYSKLPMQGNFYPMPSMAVLQDANHRLTLCSRQPLGVASLKPGWLEVMLDRKLMQDDNRGLGQGVKDNVLTFEPFKLIVERRLNDVKPDLPLVYPSLLAHYTLDSLLHPPYKFISPITSSYSIPQLPPMSFLQKPLPCDFFLLNLRSICGPSQKSTDAIMTLHRRGFDCGFDMASLQCDVKGGEIRLGRIFKDITISEATETSLSLFQNRAQLDLKKELSSHIDIMNVQAYRLVW